MRDICIRVTNGQHARQKRKKRIFLCQNERGVGGTKQVVGKQQLEKKRENLASRGDEKRAF